MITITGTLTDLTELSNYLDVQEGYPNYSTNTLHYSLIEIEEDNNGNPTGSYLMLLLQADEQRTVNKMNNKVKCEKGNKKKVKDFIPKKNK